MKYFYLEYDGNHDVWLCDDRTTVDDFKGKGYEYVAEVTAEQIPLLHLIEDNLRVIF